jgi:hypothetical protein
MPIDPSNPTGDMPRRQAYYFTSTSHDGEKVLPLPEPLLTELSIGLAILITAAWGDVEFDWEQMGFRDHETFQAVLEYFPQEVHIAIQANAALEAFLALHIKEFFEFAISLRSQKS